MIFSMIVWMISNHYYYWRQFSKKNILISKTCCYLTVCGATIMIWNFHFGSLAIKFKREHSQLNLLNISIAWFSHIYGNFNEFNYKSTLNRHAFRIWLFVETILDCFRRYFWPGNAVNSETKNKKKSSNVQNWQRRTESKRNEK